MLDLEERIRAEVTRQSDAYVPSADLPDRIDARVRGLRTRRNVVTLSVAAALVLVLGVAGALALSPGSERTDTGPSDAPSSVPTPTTVTAPPPEGGDTSTPTSAPTTATVPATTSSDATTTVPPLAPLADGEPLSRGGVGPIVAGMTLREAEAQSGRTVTPGTPIGPTSTCNEATVDGTGFHVVVTTSGVPGADPMDGVIQLVSGGESTVDGIRVGSTEAEVTAAYGEPTRRVVPPYTPDGTGLFVYERDGFAYHVSFDPSMQVVALASGYPTAWPEGCA